ncbi:MAG: BREX-1 system adenine-specific DNA-methyltransferase PglX [Reyranella sp.]
MDTNALKRFAQSARNLLISQVTAKLAVVIDPASAARRENPAAMKKLDAATAQNGKAEIIEQVAYTWFNRFTALRFMDVNGYTNPRVVSPEGDATRPEILAEAMAGNLPEGAHATIAALLDGRTPSRDPQAEAYRLLLVHACNVWHGPMPFLFEKVGDYTELLMPEDLLSPNSILARLRDAMPEDACKDVEIIGWLYQFYISEKKDQVFAGLKKNQKITAENIPAATQLFTPHWIVRYLVENSLGRLWLLNRPGSKLAERMDYYIAPEGPETDFLRISKPEEIKVCDPACGSGHILTYAFDLLYAIYEEEGYEADKISALILQHNLTGVEIDDRAGALAAFALAMKAAAKLGRRRFLRMEVKPDIVVLQNVTFTPAEMQDVTAVVGRDLFTDELLKALLQFEQAKNFGSLIVPNLRDPAETLRVVEARDFRGDLLLKDVQDRVVAVLRMAEALSSKYHVVVANPPYMGGKGMNSEIQDFTKKHYPDGKSDLFAAFIERGLGLAVARGFSAMVTMESWMFLGSFQKLRIRLLEETTIQSMVHMPYLGKGGTSMGINFGTCAFVCEKSSKAEFNGRFCCVRYYETDDHGVPLEFPPDNERLSMVSSKDFEKIPGSPIAYWVSDALRETFPRSTLLGDFCDFRIGMATGKNEWHVRQWQEVSWKRAEFGAASREAAKASGRKWFPYAKGGDFRKWAGNEESLVNWENDGFLLQNTKHPTSDRIWAHNFNLSNIFQPAICWTVVTTGRNGFRIHSGGFVFDAAAGLCQPKTDVEIEYLLGLLNSKITESALPLINPTINLHPGYLSSLPGLAVKQVDQVRSLRNLAKSDWDAYETSWDFTTLPLLSPDHRAGTLEATYTRLRTHWQGMMNEMQRLEEQNNRIFIDAYGLQDELTPEVPVEQITLTCNPAYRYGVKTSEEDREIRLRADTMTELLGYAVGCMFGRYSLDSPRLILANQGETLADYLSRVPNPSFMPDKDNVVPVLDGDWFADDIVARFRTFLRVTFGEQHLRQNLAFVEAQIGDIGRYFTRSFSDDHVKRYKKRPIYWMFSSPRGTFQALVYMHRYRPDTVSVLRNEYLVEFIRKLEAERARLEKLADDPSASQAKRTRAVKDVATVMKQIAELEEWERDVIFPLAQAKIEIDLDDGVKRNYSLFGAALKPIKGLEAADE